MKMMSEREFFRLIPKTGWKLQKNGLMRRKIKGRKASFCPVTAVAHRKLGEYYRLGDYARAATFMNLDCGFADDIATAADCIEYGPLRKKLLKHTNLTEIKGDN